MSPPSDDVIQTQWTPYTVPILVSLLATAGLCRYGYRRWRLNGRGLALSFTVLIGTFAVWSAVTLVSLTATTLGPKVATTYVGNITTGAIPLVWLWFALSYADREEWLTRRRLWALSVDPAVVLVGTLTNAWHGHMYESLSLTADAPVYLVRETGALWAAHTLYSYVVVLGGSYLIVRTVINAQRTYRLQGALVVLGALVPLVTNVAFFAGFGPDNVNLTPVVTTVSGLCFAVGVFRYRFLDLAPVARDTVVDRMSEGYVVLDGRDRVVDLNPSACRLVGVDEDAAVGRPFADLFPDASDLVETDGGARPADGAGTASRDLLFETPEGRRHVEASVSTLGGEYGNSGCVVVFRDVTERRRVELRYQRLIENATDVVTVLDADGRITFQSPSAERVLGYDPDEMVGDVVFEYVHPEDRDRAVEAFDRGVSGEGFDERLEYRFRHADGSWRTVESIGRNRLDDPVVEGVVVNSRDVTGRRRQERELAAANDRLERFASVLSHDLRNPLTVANGHLDLARAGDEAAFDEVAAAHDRMERIIENVLALAREGDEVDDPRPVDVESVARRAWNVVATDGADLVVDPGGVVVADPDRLQRALENCVRNALEHGVPDDGDPAALTITVGYDDGVLSVADDGVGVADDALAELFEEGYTTAGGTGLGLAIVRATAAAHGWDVSADHSEEGGLRITFSGVETASAAA